MTENDLKGDDHWKAAANALLGNKYSVIWDQC